MERKTLRQQDQYSCDILIHLNLFDNMTRQTSRSLVAPKGAGGYILVCTRAFHARCQENRDRGHRVKHNRDESSNSIFE